MWSNLRLVVLLILLAITYVSGASVLSTSYLRMTRQLSARDSDLKAYVANVPDRAHSLMDRRLHF